MKTKWLSACTQKQNQFWTPAQNVKFDTCIKPSQSRCYRLSSLFVLLATHQPAVCVSSVTLSFITSSMMMTSWQILQARILSWYRARPFPADTRPHGAKGCLLVQLVSVYACTHGCCMYFSASHRTNGCLQFFKTRRRRVFNSEFLYLHWLCLH